MIGEDDIPLEDVEKASAEEVEAAYIAEQLLAEKARMLKEMLDDE